MLPSAMFDNVLQEIHQAAVLAHRLCFSFVAGRGTDTLWIHRCVCGGGGGAERWWLEGFDSAVVWVRGVPVHCPQLPVVSFGLLLTSAVWSGNLCPLIRLLGQGGLP